MVRRNAAPFPHRCTPGCDARMQVVTGTESDTAVCLPPDLQAELEDALDEADRTEGISAEDLFEQLRKYG